MGINNSMHTYSLSKEQIKALQSERLPPGLSWWAVDIAIKPTLTRQEYETVCQICDLHYDKRKLYYVYQDKLVRRPKANTFHIKNRHLYIK